MQRKQNTWKRGCPCEDRREAEGNRGALSMPSRRDKIVCGECSLLDRVLEKRNLYNAYKQVFANKGAAGIDGMSVNELLPWLMENVNELIDCIKAGKYTPKPVLRIEIPKPDGGVRLLGIPTVVDRLIQQAIAQVLTPIYESQFSDYSYGFRPGRSAHNAINLAKSYYEQGYVRVVDLDLSKYFDTINHDLLMLMLRETISDKPLLELIWKYLKSGVMVNGVVRATETGSPQGGNLSPLLSNIYLTKFDREMERRGHKFVRYADDINIYVKTQRAAERVLNSCTRFLEGKLKLRINKDKSKAGSPVKLKFLGFCIGKDKRGVHVRIHPKSRSRFENKIREITCRNKGTSVESIMGKLRNYIVGWLHYYGLAEIKSMMEDASAWIRRRLRAYIWKQWKRIGTRAENLIKYGCTKETAWKWANTRKGIWCIAGSQVLDTTITNKVLMNMGMPDIEAIYGRISNSLKTLNRRMPNGTYGGVGGRLLN